MADTVRRDGNMIHVPMSLIDMSQKPRDYWRSWVAKKAWDLAYPLKHEGERMELYAQSREEYMIHVIPEGR